MTCQDAGKFSRRILRAIVAITAISSMGIAAAAEQSESAISPLQPTALKTLPPAQGDDRLESLLSYIAAVESEAGKDYKTLPLAAKAELFEWQMWRYHLTDWHQVTNHVRLSNDVGPRPKVMPGADTSTWNGALLQAMCFKYAVTRDPATLARIEELLSGLHFYQVVTGTPGYVARSVNLADGVTYDHMHDYVAPDGTRYRYWGEPAKGTYNQIVAGYAAVMLYAYDAMSPEAQRLASQDLTALVSHVIDHDYHVVDGQGNRTPYGDIRPLFGAMGVPFNAQVAYMIVATGNYFPSQDPARHERIAEQFRYLRHKHHVYYEEPISHVVQPQRVGGSPFVKGMNDRNHVTNAAFMGLLMDRERARKKQAALDASFAFQLGRTMYFSMQVIGSQRNSLCNFMYAGLLSDPQLFDCIIKRKPNTTRAQVDTLVAEGIEQLRRFRLDRFLITGQRVLMEGPQWVDNCRPDDYWWKCNPMEAWRVTGPRTSDLYCAIDYLYAYWLMRYFQLDRHPAAQKYHASVL